VLFQLLDMLAEGGVHTPVELANRLDVTEKLVERMLVDLSRMGYLRSVSGGACDASTNSAPEPCSDCPLSSACAVCEPGTQVWALTQKAFP
jgi:DeoR/GlpR family transcriptional regulator of sugar metabolism